MVGSGFLDIRTNLQPRSLVILGGHDGSDGVEVPLHRFGHVRQRQVRKLRRGDLRSREGWQIKKALLLMLHEASARGCGFVAVIGG